MAARRYNPEFPKSVRPCCVGCHRVMQLAGAPGRPRWVCFYCKHSVRQSSVGTLPFKPATRADFQAAREEYPYEARPWCVSCRRRMLIQKKRRRWQCGTSTFGCGTYYPVARSRQRWPRGLPWTPPEMLTTKAAKLVGKRELAVEITARPCCVACHNTLALSGTTRARRWNCSRCGINFKQVGKGREPRQPAPLTDANRAAIMRRIRGGDVTVEAVAITLGLPGPEVKTVFDDLIAQSQAGKIKPGYEWRRIGRPMHGAAPMGIFRKDEVAMTGAVAPRPRATLEDHLESMSALSELSGKVRRLEVQNKGERFPWETREEHALRTQYQNQGGYAWRFKGKGGKVANAA